MVEFCAEHQAWRPAGEPCPQCAAGLREVVNVLKGMVDDLAAELLQLRLRVTELEHQRNARVEAQQPELKITITLDRREVANAVLDELLRGLRSPRS
jgi:hypothetical protein